MTNADAALVLGLTQAALTVAIVADRWVHRVTGGKSVEARLTDLELQFSVYRTAASSAFDELHEKASDFQTAQQVIVGKVSERLAGIDEHLRNTDANILRLETRRRNGS